MTTTPIKAVLFDLDGTLLDTADDLGHALNHVLATKGLAPLPLTQIRPAAGYGCKGLLKLGLNIEHTDTNYSSLSEILLQHYHDHLFDNTRLFAGMEQVLTHLEKMNMPWGIVTNKPVRFTSRLVEKLQLHQRAACVISGDTLKNAKPHPEPLLHACELLGQNPKETLYIGDSEVDVIASKAAGASSLVALYGYIPAHVNPQSWKADGYIQQPQEILNWI